MANRKDKQWKTDRKCEGMRLMKEFKNTRGPNPWASTKTVIDPKTGEESQGPTLSERCTEAADEWLGTTQGKTDDELRAETWKNESPVGFAVECLSPAVRMCP